MVAFGEAVQEIQFATTKTLNGASTTPNQPATTIGLKDLI
jgi:hypothetical protein